MLIPLQCTYCTNMCLSDTLRHCHMLLNHTYDYVFSDAYNSFIYARDGKQCRGAQEFNTAPCSAAFFAAYDSTVGSSELVSARTSDLQTANKSPQKSIETRLEDVQADGLANVVQQPAELRTKEVAMIATECNPLSSNPALGLQSTVLLTPSPSPSEVPAACDRFLHATHTPPPRLNLSLTPCAVEQSSEVNDSRQSPEVAEPVKQSSNSDLVREVVKLVREELRLGAVVQSDESPRTSVTAANIPARQLAVEQDGTEVSSAEASGIVPVAIKKETEEPPKKIIKSEPCEYGQASVPSQKKVLEERAVIDLTESDDDAEFVVTDQIDDDEVLEKHSEQPPPVNKATDRQVEPVAGLPAPQRFNRIDDLKIVFSSASIDEYTKMVVSENKESVKTGEQSKQPGGKMRAALASRTDRMLNCSTESSGMKRSKPYDRARELVKKSITSRGGNQRTPAKRAEESCRYTTVFPLGHRSALEERPLRVYETNQTDDLLRCNTCKSTKVVREYGLSVQHVARYDEAPRFLLKSNSFRRQERKFSVRDENTMRVDQVRNFDSRRRIATSYDWRLSHMQVSLDRQAECLLQNLLHLRTKMSISHDTVPSHANLVYGSYRRQIMPDMARNAFARTAVSSVELRVRQSSRGMPATVSALDPPYCPNESSADSSASTSRQTRSRNSPSRPSSHKWRPLRSPSPALRTSQLGTKRPHSRNPSRSRSPRHQQSPWTVPSLMSIHPPAPNGQYFFQEPPVHFVPQQFAPDVFNPMHNANHARFRRF